MPKMKTHSGTKKRFKLTAKGKVKFQRTKTRHRMISKTKKMKRQARGTGLLKEMDARVVRNLLNNHG